MILNVDCRDGLRVLEDDSAHAIVTDPPYEIGFMGAGWDRSGIAFSPAVWRDAFRVLKPGGHVIAFSSARTYHRLASVIEDSGFEIRDQLLWIYAQGFPKSHNLDGEFEGWGTALKPAHEPMVLARKPFKGTVAENMAGNGAGAIHVDACRVGTDGGTSKAGMPPGAETVHTFGDGLNTVSFGVRIPGLGRWPSNLIHDGSEEVRAIFPHDSQGCRPHRVAASAESVARAHEKGWGMDGLDRVVGYDDQDTSAARYFYVAKPSKKERAGNPHLTVKPLALMRCLTRLVTVPGGLVLDLFSGSGTTAAACKLEGFEHIGFELDPEMAAYAQKREDES